MKRMMCLLAVFLLLGVSAFGQQRDSLIIGNAQVEFGQPSVNIPVWAVTYDSIYSYNVGFRWYDPAGGIAGAANAIYFSPLSMWDLLGDSINNEMQWENLSGVSNIDSIPNPPLFTNGDRIHIFDLVLLIVPNPLQQDVEIDTITIGSFSFGYRPVIRILGPIHIGPRPAVYEDINSIPQKFSLSQNYPNPFNASTMIEFSLAKNEDVTLAIYDLLGRRVRSLINNGIEEGSYSVIWDGKDESGRDVPSGTYFYRLSTSEATQTKRMMLIR